MQFWTLLIIFILGVAVLTAISWRTLRKVTSHGFTRYFSWVAIWALLVLNMPIVYAAPMQAPLQLSSILLYGSLATVFAGVYYLRKYGGASEQRTDDELYAFERTTALVDKGVYAYVRHPMYLSLMLLAWGLACKNLSLLSLVLAVVATLCLLLTALRDEQECIAYFGAAYQDYMQRTKRFIPFLW